MPLEDHLLAMERHLVGELLRDHVSDQTRARHRTRDGPLGQLGDHDR
jgi:hypothetical protein